MQLVLEVFDSAGAESVPTVCKTFEGAGGVIGRGAGCDWVIPDPSRLLSSHHGLVSFREGRYFLTDISSNGICVIGSQERLRKGQARLISEGDVFQLGELIIRARLIGTLVQHNPHRVAAAEPIPDDAFLALDPVHALDEEHLAQSSSDELEALKAITDELGQWMDHRAAEREFLPVPRCVEPVREVPEPQPVTTALAVNEAFWAQFAAALGIPVDGLDTPSREALAIKVASLLRHGIAGLQQCLRTCDELKTESSLGSAESPFNSPNPLRNCVDAQAALTALLGTNELGQLPAELAITQVHRDLQTHQVALLTACRSALRSVRAAFAPGHLQLCFELQDKPPRFNTDGANWRAYQRHYQYLIADEQLNERLLGNDFVNAYEEQVRLISTLHAVYTG